METYSFYPAGDFSLVRRRSEVPGLASGFAGLGNVLWGFLLYEHYFLHDLLILLHFLAHQINAL
jgi:hypothetical protein